MSINNVRVTSVVAAPPPLVPMGKFAGDFKRQFYTSGSSGALSLTQEDGGGVLRIKEESDEYVSGRGVRLGKLQGSDSIYISVDIKTVDLKKDAALFYYWLDSSGKRISQAKYVTKVSGTSKWKTYRKIIAPSDPGKTRGINAIFAVYKGEGEGYALFRNPVIRKATAQDVQEIKNASTKPAEKRQLDKSVFRHEFTGKAAGVPFAVERGKYGWLLLDSCSVLERTSCILEVDAPAAINLELHLACFDKVKHIKAQPDEQISEGRRKTIYKLGKEITWFNWGNVLLFKVDKDISEHFEITLNFKAEDASPLFSAKLDFAVIDALTPCDELPNFANRFFYAYPLARIDFDAPEAELGREVLAYLKDRGVTSPGRLQFIDDSPFPVEQGEIIAHSKLPYDAHTHSKPLLEALERHGIPMAVTSGGMRSADYIEPQMLAENGLEFYRELLDARGNEELKTQPLIWISDYEPYAFEGPVTTYSFAQESIKAFAEMVKIPNAENLTPEKILADYRKQWIGFRCYQRSQLMKAQYAALKEYSPQAKFALCSMPLPADGEDTLEYFERIGVDLRMMDPYVDLHLPMIYSRDTMFFRRTEATVRQVKKPVYVTVTCGYDNRNHDPERLARLMCGSAFLGARGVYQWPGLRSMDAAFLQSQQRAMQMIMRFNDFVARSHLVKSDKFVYCRKAKQEDFYSAVRESEGEYLMFLANESKSKTCYPRLRISGAKEDLFVAELLSGTELSPDGNRGAFQSGKLRRGISISLPPESIRLVSFSRNFNEAAAGKSVVDVSAAENAEKEQQVREEKMRRGESRDGMSYQMDSISVKIQTPVQSFVLALDNCGVGTWDLVDNNKTVRLLDKAGIDRFDRPALCVLGKMLTEVENIEISDKAVIATVLYQCKDKPYDGLSVRKTFWVARNFPQIDVEIDILPSGGYRPFAYHATHVKEVAPGEVAFQIGDAVLTDKAGKLPRGSIYVREDDSTKEDFSLSGCKILGTFNSDNCSLKLEPLSRNISCNFNSDLKALMHWQEAKVSTIELLYGDAYPDNDPHKVKTWSCRYTLKYGEESE